MELRTTEMSLPMISESELIRLGINKQVVDKACEPTVWSVANQVLYDLCKNYPRHEKRDIAIAKIWIIGRTYAAAIERGAEDAGDQFYETKVGPTMARTFDSILAPIRRIKSLTDHNVVTLMKAYQMTNRQLKKVAKKERRSLSSKYLHFHFPNLFYLYDSRALSQIMELTPSVGKNLPDEFKLSSFDPVYTLFYLRCWTLVRSIHAAYGVQLTPRQLDNLLLKRHSDQNAKQNTKKRRK